MGGTIPINTNSAPAPCHPTTTSNDDAAAAHTGFDGADDEATLASDYDTKNADMESVGADAANVEETPITSDYATNYDQIANMDDNALRAGCGDHVNNFAGMKSVGADTAHANARADDREMSIPSEYTSEHDGLYAQSNQGSGSLSMASENEEMPVPQPSTFIKNNTPQPRNYDEFAAALEHDLYDAGNAATESASLASLVSILLAVYLM